VLSVHALYCLSCLGHFGRMGYLPHRRPFRPFRAFRLKTTFRRAGCSPSVCSRSCDLHMTNGRSHTVVWLWHLSSLRGSFLQTFSTLPRAEPFSSLSRSCWLCLAIGHSVGSEPFSCLSEFSRW